LVLTDGLSVGRLVTLFLVTTTFVGLVGHLAEQLPELQAGLGALIRLRQLLSSPPEPVGGQDLPEGALDLELRDLHFAYEEGTFGLSEVCLHVPAGQTVALVGRTGSGKSTLAALLSRAVEPPEGTVLLGGADVRDLDLQQLRAAVGVVSQRTDILAGTLAENITLFEDYPRERVEAAVAELGLTGWVAGLPDGLDTALGAGGTTLSAGEEQLVAFARLLVRDVRVVVLDEATARMDPLTERRVVAAADRLLSGRTGILIAHRLSTTQRAHQVAVLAGGRILQQGRRAELAAAEGPFRELLAAAGGDAGAMVDGAGPGDGGSAGVRADAAGAQAAALAAAHPGAGTEQAEPVGITTGPATTGSAEQIGHRRRTGTPPQRREVGTGPSLTRGIARALIVRPAWGIGGAVGFLASALIGAQGAFTGFVWGELVARLTTGEQVVWLLVLLAASLLAAPLVLADAVWRYPRWWVEVLLRTRMAVLF